MVSVVIGNAVIVAIPLKQDDFTVLGVLLLFAFLGTMGIAFLPRHWLQPRDKAPIRSVGCVHQILGVLSVMCRSLADRTYLAALIWLLSAILTYTAIVGSDAIFVYFVEDWTQSGADAQSFAATLRSIAGVRARILHVFHVA